MDASSNGAKKVVACDKCKSLKVRCLRTNAQATCSKCVKSGQSCFTTLPRKRPRQPTRKRLRLADLDGKLQGILDSLEATQDTHPATRRDLDSNSSQNGNPATDELEPSTTKDRPLDRKCSTHGRDPQGMAGEEQPAEWARRLDLDNAMLERLLQRYRTIQRHFPFVVIAEDWHVSDMLETRPCLLLAALANAASHCADLQEKLAKELKDLFAQQIVVAGETSLDLLQGLLVHLVWSQYYLIPRSMQAYKQLQMAVGMLVDLGLDGDPDVIRHQRPDVHMRTDDFRSPGVGPSRLSTEAQRTSLGCWYLSSIISSSMSKPNTLALTDSVLARANTVASCAELGTDELILPLLQYQRIVEDALAVNREAHGTGDIASLAVPNGEVAAALELWWLSLPQHIRASGLFANRYHAAKVRIYDMGLLFHFRKAAPSTPSQGRHYQRGYLEASLMGCVDAIKHQLDAFLTIDLTAYSALPYEEWARLIIAMFIVFKLSAGCRDIPDWNVSLCRNIIDLEEYLSTIARRIRSTRSSLETMQGPRDELYYVLPLILESAKESYVLVRDAPSLIGPGHRVHVDLRRSRREAGASAPKCPATGFWVDKALATDNGSDWHGVNLSESLHPVDQMAKNEDLWNGLLTSFNDKD